jgi:hypothetical protein
MQIEPYLRGEVVRHLRYSIFNLNKPKEVKALVHVVQEVFKAVHQLSDDIEASNDRNFSDLCRSADEARIEGGGEVNTHKRKLDAKQIDRGMVQKVKDMAKSMGMRCRNEPLWSAAAREQAWKDAPKDRDGGMACACIKHGRDVYGGGGSLSAWLAFCCPTQGESNRAPVGDDDMLIRAHITPQKFQEGDNEKDDKYVIEQL